MNAPICIAIGMATVVYAFSTGAFNLNYMATTMFTSCDSFPLMAIPLFILAGALMEGGGLSKRLINFADSIVGHFQGGLAIVTVVTCMFFGAISGSAAATVASIGVIMVPAMIEQGYSKGFAFALIAASGCLGVLIPPSIPMVTYGVATNASIATMFMGGFGPGLLCGLMLIIFAVIICKIKGYQGNGKKFSFSRVIHTFKDAIGAMLVPIIILGGIYGGVFTPTEAAAVAVLYGLIVGAFVYKELTLDKLRLSFTSSATTTSAIMIIVATATVLARILTLEQIPAAIADLIMSLTDNVYVLLIIMNVVLLIVGCVMDSTPAILILAPILYPICAAYGINIIHFGIMMVVNISIGFITPPVGLNLFVACSIGDVKFGELVKSLRPFLVAMVIALILITYIPSITLALPSLLGYIVK